MSEPTTVPADDLAYVLEMVQQYCSDIRNGKYVLLPEEDPLDKIHAIVTFGLLGSFPRPEK